MPDDFSNNLRYITLAEFVNEVPQHMQAILTDDNVNSSTIETNIVAQKLVSAEATIESYLSRRYSLPVKASDGTVPNQLRQGIYTIAKYLLYARRNSLTDPIVTDYNNVLRWLKAVANGDADIPLVDEDGDVESEGGSIIEISDVQKSQFDELV